MVVRAGFRNWKGVHVGPDREHSAASAAGQRADHSRPGDAAVDSQAASFQLARNICGSLMFLVGKLGPAMKIVPPARGFF